MQSSTQTFSLMLYAVSIHEGLVRRSVEVLVQASPPAFNPSESFFDERQVALVSHESELISNTFCPSSALIPDS